jgi:NAD(P)-dependent dehydrogenase (short-subunit alcohol dehydrogenase family)
MMAEIGSSKSSSGARLLGKVAVVTGGSRGIGLAIARALASEACNVVISGRNQQTLERAATKIRRASSTDASAEKPKVLPCLCDVRDNDALEQMFAVVARDFGRLDILVNNAGVSQAMLPVEEISLELWREMIDTNLTGLFLCTRAALKLMQRGATIINTLSAASKTAFPSFAAYNSSKYGALGFTLSLREDLKQRGIRVTALIPGATDTELWNQVWPDAPREKMIDAESVAALVLEAVVLSPKANLTELVLDPMAGAL